ncbi:tegument protein UL51-like protein [Phocid alphaherpesvirus 1]|uniref:Tegument protein UL51-like protein n=1 Tax=Phocid alphaherpesvirus 1 TaxID=47418 RepID=A0A482F758_9ALPH|nr:tegument protein UL51-like protein [Phocid alphaherpesvirus 1]QBN85171.1 tegument protein UL51-like protein [Phocid alphaherpesvirus 1]UNP64228.1 tegument protein UL51-like protein [Phocid alphaherpesvirus 1]
MFRAILSKLCGNKDSLNCESYELIQNGPTQESLLRLQEALVVVNTLIPIPLTITDVMASSDETKRLIHAQSLARTYQACQRNLECLSKHRATSDNPSLNAVVESHIVNAKRLSDSCLAAIVHLYLSVGSVDVTTDTIVDQAIKMTSENNVVMADVAVLEKTLGINKSTTKPMIIPDTINDSLEENQQYIDESLMDRECLLNNSTSNKGVDAVKPKKSNLKKNSTRVSYAI